MQRGVCILLTLCTTSLNLESRLHRERRVRGKSQVFIFNMKKKYRAYSSGRLPFLSHWAEWITCLLLPARNSGQLSVIPGPLLSGQKQKKGKGIKQCLVPTIPSFRPWDHKLSSLIYLALERDFFQLLPRITGCTTWCHVTLYFWC